jgi:hypothetical protein
MDEVTGEHEDIEITLVESELPLEDAVPPLEEAIPPPPEIEDDIPPPPPGEPPPPAPPAPMAPARFVPKTEAEKKAKSIQEHLSLEIQELKEKIRADYVLPRDAVINVVIEERVDKNAQGHYNFQQFNRKDGSTALKIGCNYTIRVKATDVEGNEQVLTKDVKRDIYTSASIPSVAIGIVKHSKALFSDMALHHEGQLTPASSRIANIDQLTREMFTSRSFNVVPHKEGGVTKFIATPTIGHPIGLIFKDKAPKTYRAGVEGKLQDADAVAEPGADTAENVNARHRVTYERNEKKRRKNIEEHLATISERNVINSHSIGDIENDAHSLVEEFENLRNEIIRADILKERTLENQLDSALQLYEQAIQTGEDTAEIQTVINQITKRTQGDLREYAEIGKRLHDLLKRQRELRAAIDTDEDPAIRRRHLDELETIIGTPVDQPVGPLRRGEFRGESTGTLERARYDFQEVNDRLTERRQNWTNALVKMEYAYQTLQKQKATLQNVKAGVEGESLGNELDKLSHYLDENLTKLEKQLKQFQQAIEGVIGLDAAAETRLGRGRIF